MAGEVSQSRDRTQATTEGEVPYFVAAPQLEKPRLQDELYARLERKALQAADGAGTLSLDQEGELELDAPGEVHLRALEKRLKQDKLNKTQRRRASSAVTKPELSAHQQFLKALDEKLSWPWRVEEEWFEESLLATEGTEGIAQWFPGHMAKALREIGDRIRDVHVVIEVRDARAPFSSANPMLDEIAAHKPRIVVFNKSDLAGNALDAIEQIVHAFNQSYERRSPGTSSSQGFTIDHTSIANAWKATGRVSVVSRDNRTAFAFMSCTGSSTANAAEILRLLTIVAPKQKFKTVPTAALICGYPNVGKSTLINALRTLAEQSGIKDHGYTLTNDPKAIDQAMRSAGASIPLLTRNASTSNSSRQLSSSSKNTPSSSKYSEEAIRRAEAFAVGGTLNVQKSALLDGKKMIYVNTHQKTKDAKVGPEPGVTRHVSGFKVQENPPLVILDTPGVMIPKLSSNTVAIRLALVGSIADKIVGIDLIAAYLLQSLNRMRQFNYVKVYQFPTPYPTDELRFLLYQVAKSMGMKDPHLEQWRKELSDGKPDLVRAEEKRRQRALEEIAAGKRVHEYITMMDMSPDLEQRAKNVFIKMYRSGALGKFFVDANELALTS